MTVARTPPAWKPSRSVRSGWGAAVALGASTAILLFSALVAASTWWGRRSEPVRTAVVAAPAADVDLWVADVAPGVKAVLSSQWNDPEWDRLQDERLNRSLGLEASERLAFYEAVAFNTSDEPATVSFAPGALAVTPAGSTAPVRSHDLSALLARPDVAASAAAATLRALGADRATVVLPPGRLVRRPVAFPAGLDLATAEGVAFADGVPFHRRRIRRVEWAGILLGTSADRIRAL